MKIFLFFFSNYVLVWEKVLFCAGHMLVPALGAVHTAGTAVLQMASELHLLWVAAGGSLSLPASGTAWHPAPAS